MKRLTKMSSPTKVELIGRADCYLREWMIYSNQLVTLIVMSSANTSTCLREHEPHLLTVSNTRLCCVCVYLVKGMCHEVVEMGNIAPVLRFEPTPLACWRLYHLGSPIPSRYPHLYRWPLVICTDLWRLRGQCKSWGLTIGSLQLVPYNWSLRIGSSLMFYIDKLF